MTVHQGPHFYRYGRTTSVFWQSFYGRASVFAVQHSITVRIGSGNYSGGVAVGNRTCQGNAGSVAGSDGGVVGSIYITTLGKKGGWQETQQGSGKECDLLHKELVWW